MKIIFLASGNGGNLKFIFKALIVKKIAAVELFVVADRECGAVRFALSNSIPATVIKYSKNNNSEFLEILSIINPDLIITNWHRIIDRDAVSLFSGKMINLHYSLLPAFGGLIGVEPIKRAYERGCQYVGATCHIVSEEVDAGRIVAQAIVKTNIEIEKAINQVFRKGCFILLNTLLERMPDFLGHSKTSLAYDFSPPLRFDVEQFDEPFWDELATA